IETESPVKTVPPGIAGRCPNSVTAQGIHFTQYRQVEMITQAQIIPEIFGRKSKGSILPETGKDNPGSTLLRFRKETERHPHRQWDPLDKQVGRTGDDLRSEEHTSEL